MTEKTRILFFDRDNKYRNEIFLDEEVLNKNNTQIFFCNSYDFACPWEKYQLIIIHFDEIEELLNIPNLSGLNRPIMIIYDDALDSIDIDLDIHCNNTFSMMELSKFKEKFNDIVEEIKKLENLNFYLEKNKKAITYNNFLDVNSLTCILDEKLQFKFASRKFLNLIKYFWKELSNMPFQILLTAESFQDEFLSIKKKLDNKKNWCGELKIEGKDHRQLWISGSIYTIDDGDETIYYCMFQDYTKLKKAELDQNQLINEQKAILENTMIGIIYVIDRKLVWANPKFLELLNYDWDELKYRSTSIIYPDIETFNDLGEKINKELDVNNQFFAEVPLKDKMGNIIYTKYSGRYIDQQKPEKGCIMMVEDISEKRDIEQELIYQKNLFENSISALTEMLFLVNKESGEIILCNDSVEDIFGFAKSEVVNNKLNVFFKDEFSLHDFYFRLNKELTNNKLFISEEELQRKNGESFPVEVKISSILDDHKNEILVCILRDITERKHYEQEQKSYNQRLENLVELRTEKLAGVIEKLEDEIRERRKVEDSLNKIQNHFAKSQKIAKVGNWEWDIVNDSLYWSDELYNIYGIKRKEKGLTYNDFLNSIHPEDRDYIANEINEALENYKIYDVIHRIITPDNKIKIVHGQGDVYFEEDTAMPMVMIGTTQDISNTKKIEKQLELATTVLESAIEGVVITDSTTKILSVNPAFTKITGYSPDEVIGKKINILKSHTHKSTFYENMWEDISKKGFWQGEIWNRKKSGEAYPEWLTINGIRDETGKLTKYVAVFYDMSEIKLGKEKLQYHLDFDALTNVHNKNYFRNALGQKINSIEGNNEKFSIILLGLDRFKKVNESLGHVEGDKLLKIIASKLKEIKSKEDIFARWESDEFIFLINNTGEMNDVISFTFDIMSVFKDPIVLKGHSIYLTSSLGIAVYPNDGSNSEMILKNVEIAMHLAKDSGRNNYQFYSPELSKESQNRLKLELELRNALEQEEFELYYQAKVNGVIGKIVGAEVLIRWNHKDRGLVSPAEFIPILEESDLIISVSEWVLEKACWVNKSWQEKYNLYIPISVNISAIQFMSDTLFDKVHSVLSKSGLEGRFLDLEITEGVLINNVDYTISLMKELKQLEILLSIDDFGTGYSSLSYLKKFPIDQLKIDKAFISDIGKSQEDSALVEAIISLGHSLRLKLIAEGVETKEQLNFLIENFCDEIQGYYFSKPLPKKDFEQLIADGACFTK